MVNKEHKYSKASGYSERAIDHIDRRFFKIESLTTLISALVIMCIMLLGVMQILGRSLFNFGLPGYIDMVEVSMVIFAFGAIGYCQRLGGHIRMEFFISRMEGRTLYVTEFIGVGLGLIVITVIAYYSYFHFERALLFGDSTMDIELPTWPAKLFVTFALSMLSIRLLIELVGFGRLIINPSASPIAVPQIETVDEQAQREIDVGLAGEEQK